MITLGTARQLYDLLIQQENRLSTYPSMTQLHALEERYTFWALKKIFCHTLYESIHTPLADLLAERWPRIRSSDINYCQNQDSPINTVCIAIAKALANQAYPYFVFLMPSLANHEASSYITSSYQDDIKLHECIVNDDGTRLIHIHDVLSFSKVDGILKHNYLSKNNTVETLSKSERNRLLMRHPSISECLNAIHNRLTFTRFGNTTGGALRRLIDGLNEGGKQNGHDEFKAGDSANFAVIEFARYLETLDEETKKNTLSVGLFDRFTTHVPELQTIGEKWKLLSDPHSRKRNIIDDTIYCVEMIARDLDEILEENPGLYETTSCKDASINTLATLSVEIDTALENVQKSLPETPPHIAYGKKDKQILFHRLIDQFSRDKTFHLTQDEIIYIAIQGTGEYRTAQESCQRLLTSIVKRNTPKANEHLLNALPSRCHSLLQPPAPPEYSSRMFQSQRRERRTEDVMPKANLASND